MGEWFAIGIKVLVYGLPLAVVAILYIWTGGNPGLGTLSRKLADKISAKRGEDTRISNAIDQLVELLEFIAVPPGIVWALLTTPTWICTRCAYYHDLLDKHIVLAIALGEIIVISIFYVETIKKHIIGVISTSLLILGLIILYNIVNRFGPHQIIILDFAVLLIAAVYSRRLGLAGLSACSALIILGLFETGSGRVVLGRYYQMSGSTEMAQQYYQLAADQGNATAQVDLGLLYADGDGGTSKDDREAARLFALAAGQGNAAGQAQLGLFSFYGRGGIKKDALQASRLFKSSAEHGDPVAQNALGVFYANGLGGLAQDDLEAAHLFELAAAQGDVAAQNNLSVYYLFARGGVDLDVMESARLLRAAAQSGNVTAEINLADCYVVGTCGTIVINIPKAMQLYRLASDQGSVEAHRQLIALSDEREKNISLYDPPLGSSIYDPPGSGLAIH
jgi:hypothetical protein